MSDLPDYTKYIAAAPAPVPTPGTGGTKSETVDHEEEYLTGGQNITLTLAAPPDGEKIGLILVVGSTTVDGGVITIETLQSGLWAEVIDDLYLRANESLPLVFPCWIPTQDVGDGTTQTVRVKILGAACAAKTGVFVLYFFE